MSSRPQPEDDDPHSSGYEGDISDGFSISGASDDESPSRTSSDEGVDESNQADRETVWVGYSSRASATEDVTQALAEGENEDDSRFGIIWIGCSIRDMGLTDYRGILDAAYTAELAHIENIQVLEGIGETDNEVSDADSTGGRPVSHFFLPPLFLFLFFFLLLLLIFLRCLIRFSLGCGCSSPSSSSLDCSSSSSVSSVFPSLIPCLLAFIWSRNSSVEGSPCPIHISNRHA
ncbi:uncharacterized protein BJX67DRAFT_245007 [Aspergillus lucknowensis]|uniref:Uncharacterized protein n=1 Tax=Aspergillus lucknowensis TaxID=176173 RepID=A0ABR4M1Q6_9EURO